MDKLITCLLILSTLRASAQELSHIQYTVKDGLPGSIVYESLQDHNGFLWFCTNQGVSRFDGKAFKNFSKEDGLPDDEILKLYLDAYGDVWFISLGGIPSVYYNGAIHRIDSCSDVFSITEDFISGSIRLLTNIRANGIEKMGYYASVDAPGHWSFHPYRYRLTKWEDLHSQSVLRASSDRKINFYFGLGSYGNYSVGIKGGGRDLTYFFPHTPYSSYLPIDGKSFYSLTADKTGLLFFTDTMYIADDKGLRSLFALSELHLSNLDLNYIYCENDSTLWICSRNRGLLRVKNFQRRNRTITSYFPAAFCTSITEDREGGYWVTTLDDGIYYLPNLDSYYLSADGDLSAKDVKCIRALDHHFLISGFANGNIVKINDTNLHDRVIPLWDKANINNRILDIKPYGDHRLVVGDDYGLHLLSDQGNSQRLTRIKSIKGIFCLDDTAIVFASADGLFRVAPGFSRTYCMFISRTTCVDGIGRKYYWGTLNGLYGTDGDSTKFYGSISPMLCGVINHIDLTPDSIVWVSTQQGIVVLQGNDALAITKTQGLISNRCKSISFDGQVAWVSTDKGISRIAFHWNRGALLYTISNITENDGLISNAVNQTAVGGGYVWAATARGISIFAEDYTPHSMTNPLININAQVSGKSDRSNVDTIALDYKNNKLAIELSGISFRSGKQIAYQYRLRDLDKQWTNTSNSLLEFSTLPFGVHIFEARVIDRWGIASSQVRRLTIFVQAPFWKTWWFTWCIYLLTAVLIGFLVNVIVKRQNLKKNRESKLRTRMADLEMMALRSQMNPHFIFNCLSSIQHYILRADIRNANLYLHKFSALIRKTLQHSVHSYITLEEELSILGLYMELEKLRLSDRMDYTIELSPDIHPSGILIPSMIIQPFVENAVKHGISPLQDIKGAIRIAFKQTGRYLVCTIEDNGLGIHAPRRENAHLSQGHQPLGLHITKNRIKILNVLQKDDMSLTIKDKGEMGRNEHGTIVQIDFIL